MAHSRIRARVAGQSAMSLVVHAQSLLSPRGAIARFFGVDPLSAEAREHYSGALGELLVGDVLENLGPSWDVLHDVPLGGSVLDHLLIGRPGVYSVRAVNYGREDVMIDGDGLTVSGDPRDDIDCARRQADQVSDLLGAAADRTVEVTPLLVVVDPRRLIVAAAPSDVRVIASRELQDELSRAIPTLSGDEVARLSDIADRTTTWPAGDAVDLDTLQLNRDFGVIRVEVRDALTRRIAWLGAATLVLYSTVCTLIATLVTMLMGN